MSNLFVDEDEEMSPVFASIEEEDEIITEIPILLKNTEVQSHELVALQFANRPKERELVNDNKVLEARLKDESGFIEVDIPVDTSKFYDANKSEEWGGVSRQTLQGVLLELEGYYIGNIKDGELVLLPLNRVTQLRTSLKHIDKEANDKKELLKLENSNRSNQQNDIQVVQMTVKNTSDNIPRLGNALLARKKVDEEKFQVFKWNDLNEANTNNLRKRIITVNDKIELKALTTNQEYLDLLVKETLV